MLSQYRAWRRPAAPQYRTPHRAVGRQHHALCQCRTPAHLEQLFPPPLRLRCPLLCFGVLLLALELRFQLLQLPAQVTLGPPQLTSEARVVPAS
eukprot:903556-Rhodomonas_salina.2